jgi:hypothetical protein
MFFLGGGGGLYFFEEKKVGEILPFFRRFLFFYGDFKIIPFFKPAKLISYYNAIFLAVFPWHRHLKNAGPDTRLALIETGSPNTVFI